MSNLTDITVLYIEDDAVTAAVMKRKLEAAGARVEIAFSGENGLDLIERQGYDILLIDYGLPGMAGIEVIAELKSRRVTIPIIMITGYDSVGLAVEAMKLGAYEYLIKDISGSYINLTATVIEKALAKHRLVTEQEETYRRLQESEKRFRNLVSTVPDIVYRIDRQGVFNLVNESVALLGYRPEDLIGHHYRILLHPDEIDRVSLEPVLKKIQEEGHISTAQPLLFNERRTGYRSTKNLEVMLISRSYQPGDPIEPGVNVIFAEVMSAGEYDLELYEGEKKFLGTVGIIRDITQRKLTEENLRRLNLELEDRVRERTVDLEVANRELEAFAHTVSHDLQSPLKRIIRSANGLLERSGGLSADLIERLREILESAGGMNELIGSLLKFSRSARADLQQRPVDLNQLVREVLVPIRGDTGNRNIDWRVGDLPTVFGDYALLRQVLVNLIDNAVKYTTIRERAVISIEPLTSPQGMIGFQIRDNGAGFQGKYANRLFRVFSRLHAADQFEGSGVGLATVKRIIDRHGGRVGASGEPERGAVFSVLLPANEKITDETSPVETSPADASSVDMSSVRQQEAAKE